MLLTLLIVLQSLLEQLLGTVIIGGQGGLAPGQGTILRQAWQLKPAQQAPDDCLQWP